MANPIEQFVVKTLVPLGSVGGVAFGVTNAAVFMSLCVVLIVGGLLWATRRKALVPGRSQEVAEMLRDDHEDDLSRYGQTRQDDLA